LPFRCKPAAELLDSTLYVACRPLRHPSGEAPMAHEQLEYDTFEATVRRSAQIEEDLKAHPERYRVLTGDRPTGRLHVGIGEGGGGKLKATLTQALNEYLRPLRAKRRELESNPEQILSVLKTGIERARTVGQETLNQVRRAMNMDLG
jgi:hypothetical protein